MRFYLQTKGACLHFERWALCYRLFTQSNQPCTSPINQSLTFFNHLLICLKIRQPLSPLAHMRLATLGARFSTSLSTDIGGNPGQGISTDCRGFVSISQRARRSAVSARALSLLVEVAFFVERTRCARIRSLSDRARRRRESATSAVSPGDLCRVALSD